MALTHERATRQTIGIRKGDQVRVITGRDIELSFEDWRQGDQRWFVADTSAARAALHLPTRRGWRESWARAFRS